MNEKFGNFEEIILGDRVRGVLLWNVWDSVPAARAMLAAPSSYGAVELTGKSLKQRNE